MNDPEYQVIRNIGKGDHLAFKHLVRRYQNPLLNFTYRYTGDRQTAEDLVQEVFLRVYQAAPRFKPRAKVSTWIFKIAYNLCMNEIRRRKRILNQNGPFRMTAEEQAGTAASDMTRQMELEQSLSTLLNRLPENQRAALLLRVCEGHSYQEISDILGISFSSVESLIYRARDRMRKLMSKDEVS